MLVHFIKEKQCFNRKFNFFLFYLVESLFLYYQQHRFKYNKDRLHAQIFVDQLLVYRRSQPNLRPFVWCRLLFGAELLVLTMLIIWSLSFRKWDRCHCFEIRVNSKQIPLFFQFFRFVIAFIRFYCMLLWLIYSKATC